MEQADLPEEVLLKVFTYLPISDLKNVVQVCRFWKELGEYPLLWKWCPVMVNRKNSEKMFKSYRFSMTFKVVITEDEYTVEELDAILSAVLEQESITQLVMDPTCTTQFMKVARRYQMRC